jgi:hypothetical protein
MKCSIIGCPGVYVQDQPLFKDGAFLVRSNRPAMNAEQRVPDPNIEEQKLVPLREPARQFSARRK